MPDASARLTVSRAVLGDVGIGPIELVASITMGLACLVMASAFYRLAGILGISAKAQMRRTTQLRQPALYQSDAFEQPKK